MLHYAFSILLSLLLLFPFPGFGQELHFEINTLSDIKSALQTDPRALKVSAEGKLQNLGEEQTSATWVQAFLAYTLAVNELGSLEPLRLRYADLLKAMQEAQRLGLHEEFLLLRYVWIFVPDPEGKVREELTFLKDLVRLADQFNIPAAKVKARMDLAYNMRERGDTKQALMLLNEMNDIVKAHPEIDLVDRLIVQNQSAISFLKQGQHEQAHAIHEAIAVICRREGYSYLGSIMENHLGDFYASKGDPASLEQAEMHYRNALQITRKQANGWLEATVSLNLAQLHMNRNETSKSRVLARRAAELFEVNDDVMGVADAASMLGLLAIDARQWREAAAQLDRAEKIYMEHDYKESVRTILEARSKMYEGMGDLRRALDLLKAFVAEFKNAVSDRNQKSIAELLVNTGLKVEAERNKALQKENELQAQEISAARKIRVALVVVAVLALGILVLLIQVYQGSQQIRTSKLKMQRILDHIEEGIFTINAQLHIEGESSAFLQQIFELHEPPTGHDALDILLGQSHLNAEERSMVREVLRACIHEEVLAFELNAAHLPTELQIHGQVTRIVLVHWTPLFDKDKRIHGFLVNLHDATVERRLAAAVEAEKSKSQEREHRILEIVRAERTALRKAFADAHRVMESLGQASLTEDQIQDAFRDLHTIKGVARTLGMRAMSLGSHELEGKLLVLREKETLDLSLWEQHIAQFRSIVQDYEALVQQIEQGSAINHADDGNLAHEVGRHQNMVVKLLKRQKVDCESFEVIDELIHWPEELLQAAGEVLVHSLTNSVDHGFNLPKVRGLPVAAARFRIHAREEGSGAVSLEIQDNGQGLDLDLLKALAKQRAWAGQTFAELTPMLFLDGLSTAEKATATSGRGVGLAAIRAIAEKWQGSAEIMPNADGRGCCLTVHLKTPKPLAASA
ncbi:ATP-binding protein [Oligoflexus tunisiensis]|uniref:ATP-binding protein n=1 Tax=Oligoflexus tunisiensis TaxID=708132 RepID=UPI00159F065E|nr:ATP-binding protein [Oligoflexus tunisiensis]